MRAEHKHVVIVMLHPQAKPNCIDGPLLTQIRFASGELVALTEFRRQWLAGLAQVGNCDTTVAVCGIRSAYTSCWQAIKIQWKREMSLGNTRMADCVLPCSNFYGACCDIENVQDLPGLPPHAGRRHSNME